MKTIHLVAGARPNFMKIAPIIRALKAYGGLAFNIIHTGQHYDQNMNDVFFEELGIPQPDVFMGAGGGSHAQQTAKIMQAFEEICQTQRPDLELVVGDVNSTLACSIVAKKQNIPVAHVEAGLRSRDMTMPEEINRIVTDSISDFFFVTEPSRVAAGLRDISQRLPLIFPVHPRSRGNLDRFGIDLGPNVILTQPLSYMEFLNLWKDATVVLTDSGGLQEETTALGIPCLTIRENTERPITVTEGTNVLVGTDPVRMTEAALRVPRGEVKRGRRPHLWDGHATERIVEILRRELAVH